MSIVAAGKLADCWHNLEKINANSYLFGENFQIGEIIYCVGSVFTAHQKRRLKINTKLRPAFMAKQFAGIVSIQVYTAHACRFAVGHTWQW